MVIWGHLLKKFGNPRSTPYVFKCSVQCLYLYDMSAGEFITGRVIKAMNNSWHPECFCCDICHTVLADVGFAKNAGR